nr:hypothetical protein [Tanacetum cinerariifolium]
MFLKYSTNLIPLKKSRGKGSQGKKTANISQESVDVFDESEPEPAKKKTGSRSTRGAVIQDTPSAPKPKPAASKLKLKGVQSLTPEEQEVADTMQALKESKKTSRRQLGIRGSSEGIGRITRVPDESKVVSATSNDGIVSILKIIIIREDYQEYGLSVPDSRGKGSQGKKTSDISQELVDVFDESEPEPAKKKTGSRSTRGAVIQDTPKQEAADTMQALKESKKTSRRQLGIGGSSEGIGRITRVPDESKVVSATSSEGTGTKPGVLDEEKVISKENVILEWGSDNESEHSEDSQLNSDEEDKKDNNGDADDEDEDNDHISDTQDTDKEDAKTESAEDEIYKYKIQDGMTDAAKADVEKTVKGDAELAGNAMASDYQVKVSTKFPLPSSSLSVSSGFETPQIESPSVLQVHVSVISEATTLPPIPEIPTETPVSTARSPTHVTPTISILQHATKPIPIAPITIEAPTITTVISEFDALTIVLQTHIADLIQKYSMKPTPEPNKIQKPTINLVPETKKTSFEIHKIKKEQAKKKKMPKYTTNQEPQRQHDDDEDPSAGPNQGKKTKRRRTKESESFMKPSTTKETSKGKAPSKSSKTGKSATTKKLIEEPITDVVMDDLETNANKDVLWFNRIVSAVKDPLTFDELMATPFNFSKFAINHLKLDHLTQEILAGPVYNLLKGTCNRSIELEEKVHYIYPKTKAARYEIIGIEDMVLTLWSPTKVGYDKDALKGIKHWGDKQKLCQIFPSDKKLPDPVSIGTEGTSREQKKPQFTIKSTNKAALEEYDLKSAIYQSIHANKSFYKNPINHRLYHALMEALIEDENTMDKEVADTGKDHKRKHDDDDEDDDDKDPPAGPKQGKKTKRRRTKESKSSKKPSTTKETPKDDDGYDVVRDDDQPQDTSEFKTRKTLNLDWFKQSPKPPTLSTCSSSIELEYNFQECFNALIDKLDWNNPEGDRYPFDLSKPLPLQGPLGYRTIAADYFLNNDLEYLKTSDPEVTYTSSITKTKAARYEIKGIEDMIHTLWSKQISKQNVYSTKEILGVKSVSVMKLHRYRQLVEIMVKRSDQQLYMFKKGDFVDLHLNDIEDMLLLTVQHKLFHLDEIDIVDFIVALCMFTRSLILKRRVKDLQLGVERIVYEDLDKQKTVLQADELYKFSDGTLKSVRDEIHHRVLDFCLDYNKEMPKRKWTVVDPKRLSLMIELIDKQLREREIIKNMKRLVGARELEMHYKLMTRTI